MDMEGYTKTSLIFRMSVPSGDDKISGWILDSLEFATLAPDTNIAEHRYVYWSPYIALEAYGVSVYEYKVLAV